jgi:recombination protein RecA
MPAAPDRGKALELALAQIDKQFGKGSVMRLGEEGRAPIEVIPTGSIALDMALGIGGYPKGRIVEVYGPESSGKCMTADTYVWTARGLETVAELFERCGQPASCKSRVTDVTEHGVRMVNERGELETVAALTHNNRRPVRKIKLQSGRCVTVTDNHPLRVMSERGFMVWRKAVDIKPGDTVVSGLFGAVQAAEGDGLSEDEATLLGYLVAEGTLTYRERIRFTNWDPEVTAEFAQLVKTVLGVEVRSYYGKEHDVSGKAIRELFAERYGMDYVAAAGKNVPSCVRTAGHKAQRAFLSALFEGDGWIDKSSTVGLGTASEQLAREVQLMLYGLGVPATVSAKFNTKYERDYWTVAVNPASAELFLSEVGFRSERRRAQVATNFRAATRDAQFRNIPHVAGLIKDLRDDCGGDRQFDRIVGDLFRTDMALSCSAQRLRKLATWCAERADRLPSTSQVIAAQLRALAEAAYTYETVASVEDAGVQPTFDVVLPETHSFIANGILSHNTTVALHAVANAQRQGGIAAFIDAEHALDPDYAKALGVDTDALLVSQPDTGEQALEIADMLIRSGALDVLVIDSVAALVPRAEIEGEMGDSHVGLQARLMSQALRKITGALSNSGTTAIFINQLREKVGVMFGCFTYSTRVTLADGTQEKIGKIVNQKLPVEVMSYDPEIDRMVPRKVVNWFNNGKAEKFLQFTVAKSGGNGRAQFAATENHLIRTAGGWQHAGELIAGDRVMLAEEHRLSEQQWQVVLGSLMGDGNLSPNTRDRSGVRFRLGHGAAQSAYLDWKVELFGNISCSRSTNDKGAVFADFTPLAELGELQRAVYFGDGKKHLSWDYLKALTPLALALWYMDDGCFTVRSKGVQERTQGGTGRIEICLEAMSPGTRERIVEYLRDNYHLDVKLSVRGARQISYLQFTTAATEQFQQLVAPYVHPSMEYKLLPRFRGQYAVRPEFAEPEMHPVPARVIDIHVKPRTRSMNRFDIEVEGNHNYLVDGVLVHNSPETTTGGKALKFYASVRLDVRRIETMKDGGEAVGNRTRVKVVKNKCLAEGTRIFDPVSGVTHRIEDIVDQRLPVHVVASDKRGELHVRPVVSWFDQGTQDVVGLRFGGGAELWVTPDHKVLTPAGWRLAGELAPGDRVARPLEFLGFGTERPFSVEHARLLGYLIGDGYVGGKTPVHFVNVAQSLIADATRIASGLGCSVTYKPEKISVAFSHRKGVRNGIIDLCREAGIWGSLAFEKKIPQEFFAPDVCADMVANLIFGLFETDGHVSREKTGGIRVGFTTTSEQLAQQIHWLLLRWGIGSSVRSRAPRSQGGDIAGRRIVGRRQVWEVRLSGIDNVSGFADAIPMWGPRGMVLRQYLAQRTGRYRSSQQVYVPDSWIEPVLEHLRQHEVTPGQAAALIGEHAGDPKLGMRAVLGMPRMRRDRLERLADGLDSAFLREVLAEQVWYSAIGEVLPVRRCRTFDVEVEELHNLVADDVVVHNCAPPFKQAEFDILYGHGISREGSLIDMGVEQSIVRKSGAWYTYEGDQLGQGKENARRFLRENPDVANEVEKRIKEKLGIGAKVDVEEAPGPVDF